jgi:hypothetical protein
MVSVLLAEAWPVEGIVTKRSKPRIRQRVIPESGVEEVRAGRAREMHRRRMTRGVFVTLINVV